MSQSSDMAMGTTNAGDSDGAALPLILDHYMAYPGSYEMPLRTMYTLNSAPSFLTNPNAAGLQESAFAERHSPPPWLASLNDASGQFRAQIMAQIAKLPTQPSSLPPHFIISFVRRCFAPRLEDVDFPQALTALDYLNDLETRRIKDVSAALRRLDVRRGDKAQLEELRSRYPGVVRWIETMEEKEKMVERLYTQVYVSLRRWVLINEMMLEPFNKANCLAMLNTLFPPTIPRQPTAQLTPQLLKQQREGTFKYIRGVETHGKQVVYQLMKTGAQQGDDTAWPLVRDALDKYLDAAQDIIASCEEVKGRDYLEEESRRGHRRKPDSGISFGSSVRTTESDDHSSRSNSVDKPLPPSPESELRKPPVSKLEKITRELRRIRSRIDGRDRADSKSRSPSLARGRSSRSSSDEFDELEARRERLIRARANEQAGQTH